MVPLRGVTIPCREFRLSPRSRWGFVVWFNHEVLLKLIAISRNEFEDAAMYPKSRPYTVFEHYGQVQPKAAQMSQEPATILPQPFLRNPWS